MGFGAAGRPRTASTIFEGSAEHPRTAKTSRIISKTASGLQRRSLCNLSAVLTLGLFRGRPCSGGHCTILSLASMTRAAALLTLAEAGDDGKPRLVGTHPASPLRAAIGSST